MSCSQGHQHPSLSTESTSGQVHPGHAAAMMAAGLNGNVAAPLPLEAEDRPAKRQRTGNRMVRSRPMMSAGYTIGSALASIVRVHTRVLRSPVSPAVCGCLALLCNDMPL